MCGRKSLNSVTQAQVRPGLNVAFYMRQLLNGDMVFSRKTKVSCYISEINKSVMLHAFLKKQRYRFTVFDKSTKVSRYGCKKARNKISANGISHFVTF